MSEEVKTDEVDAVAELKSVIDTAVETKADVSAIEEVKAAHAAEIEAVKSEAKEALEAAKSEVLEAVEQKFDALPAIVKTENKSMDVIKFEDVDFNGSIVKAQKFDVVTKNYLDNTDVNGGRVSGQQPYFILEQNNVLGRQLGTVIPASGVGVVKLPDVHEISWASEAAQPAAARSPGGDLASKNVTIETWVTENQYSMSSLQDVPGMDAAITGLMSARLGLAEQADAVAVIKAATLATGHNVTTGVNTGTDRLPTAANVIGRMANIREAMGSGYGNRTWIVSRELMGRLQESNNTTLNFDPRMGVQTLFGDPVIVIDDLEASGTTGNLVGAYGDFSRGLAMCSNSEMMIGRYDQTRPGSMTYFGHARFKHAVWDTSALVTFKVGA